MRHALWPLLVIAAGCFSDGPADGVYSCAAVAPECPPSFYCAADGRCRRGGDGGDGQPDLGPACGDGTLGGNESDIDCGGDCAACAPGRACRDAKDCATASCIEGHCELATAPPFWLPLPSLTRDRVSPNVVATPDGKLVVVGGADRTGNISNAAEVLSLASATPAWGAFPEMLLSRSASAAGLIDGRIVVAGGKGNETQLESYDFAAAKWTVLQDNIGFQVDEAGFTVVGTSLFVFGGFDLPAVPTGSAHRLQGTTWQELAKLTPRRALAGATGADGLVYAIGGSDGTRELDLVQAYDPTSGQWKDSTALPEATASLAAIGAPDGRVYAIGGRRAGAAVAGVVAFTPGARWSGIAPLQNPRNGAAATIGSDGRIYLVGGARSGEPALRDVEAYGPVVQVSGSPPSASGSNFAANARVLVYTGDSTTPLAAGMSDGSGKLAALALPGLPAGTHVLRIVDERSRYPVTATVTVTP